MEEPTGIKFSTRLKGPDFLRIGIVFGALVILLMSATLAVGAAPGASPGASADPSASPPAVDQDAQAFRGPLAGPMGGMRFFTDLKGQDGQWMGPGPLMGRRNGGPFGQISVTAINGSSISLKTDNGWTRTITVPSGATITKGGQAATLADLKVGDSIRLGESRNSDGSFTITAIEILVPEVAGTVASVTSDGFTVDAGGTTWTITVTGSTTYSVGKNSGSKADVVAGAIVDVEGARGTGNTLTATAVRVLPQTVAGEVTDKSGNSLTIRTIGGGSAVIHVSGSTTYRVAGSTNPSLSDITVGSMVLAQGTRRSDGSLDATSVFAGQGVVGRGLGRGFGPRRGFDNGIGPWGRGPAASPSPSASGSQS